jgi:hypothetical protein
LWINCYFPKEYDYLLTDNQLLSVRDTSDLVRIDSTDIEKFTNALIENDIPFKNWGMSIYIAGGRTSRGYHGSYMSSDYWEEALSELAEEFMMPIVATSYNEKHPSGEDKPKHDYDGKFYFHFAATPMGIFDGKSQPYWEEPARREISFETLEGETHTLSCTKGYILRYNPSDLQSWQDSKGEEVGTIAIRDTEGSIIGFVWENHAWITLRIRNRNDYNPEVDARCPTAPRWLPYLRLLAQGMLASLGDLDEFVNTFEERQRKENIARWCTLVEGRHGQKIDSTRKALAQAVEGIEIKREEMVNLLRKVPELKKALAIAETFTPDLGALEREFDKIHKFDGIASAEINKDGDTFIFTTDLIKMRVSNNDILTKKQETLRDWKDLVFPIGRFRVELHTSGRVKITNLTNAKASGAGEEGYWHHPHVPRSGPCLGKIESLLPKLLAEYAFGEAAILIVRYLSVCNADDEWGANIHRWHEDAYNENEEPTAAVEA